MGYSPINLSELYIALEKYPRKDIAKLLKDGCTSGIKINYTGLRLQLDTKKILFYSILWWHMKGLNMTFLLAEQQDILRFPLISNLRCSPIGLVPKKSYGWSLITQLSFPPGNSVNDFIDEQLTTVQFSKFDNVISTIQTLGEHVKIGK